MPTGIWPVNAIVIWWFDLIFATTKNRGTSLETFVGGYISVCFMRKLKTFLVMDMETSSNNPMRANRIINFHFSFINWRLTRKMEQTVAAIQRCSVEKVFWTCATNSQENTRVKVRFQHSCFATLLKSHFGMGVLL